MRPYTFPDWTVYLSTGRAITKAEWAGSSLSYQAGYGQTAEYVLTLSGELVRELYDSGELEQGLYMREVWAGYEGELELIARDLLIWDDRYASSAEEGDTLTLTAYGCLQKLMQSGERTLKLAARTYAQAAQEVAARHGLRIRVGPGAYRPIPQKDQDAGAPAPPAGAGGDLSSGLAGQGVTAAAKPSEGSRAAGQPRKAIYQEGESDYEFLSKLGREIGYVLAETDLGDELYFGPGIEVGARPRYLLVGGEYSVEGRVIAPNVGSLEAARTLWGIPAELVVTGVEKGQRFALLVTPDDLAERVKITTLKGGASSSNGGAPQGDLSSGLAGAGVTGTVRANSAGQAVDAQGRYVRTTASAGDFASKRVAELLRASGFAPRRVLGGASSRLDALERGLEALALEQLRFQEVAITIYGIPSLKPGLEVILEGSRIPKALKGLYLVREVSGAQDPEAGFDMKLVLNRNTV